VKRKALIHSLQNTDNFEARMEKKVKVFNENIALLQKDIPELEKELLEYINMRTLTTNFNSHTSIDYREF